MDGAVVVEMSLEEGRSAPNLRARCLIIRLLGSICTDTKAVASLIRCQARTNVEIKIGYSPCAPASFSLIEQIALACSFSLKGDPTEYHLHRSVFGDATSGTVSSEREIDRWMSTLNHRLTYEELQP